MRLERYNDTERLLVGEREGWALVGKAAVSPVMTAQNTRVHNPAGESSVGYFGIN